VPPPHTCPPTRLVGGASGSQACQRGRAAARPLRGRPPRHGRVFSGLWLRPLLPGKRVKRPRGSPTVRCVGALHNPYDSLARPACGPCLPCGSSDWRTTHSRCARVAGPNAPRRTVLQVLCVLAVEPPCTALAAAPADACVVHKPTTWDSPYLLPDSPLLHNAAQSHRQQASPLATLPSHPSWVRTPPGLCWTAGAVSRAHLSTPLTTPPHARPPKTQGLICPSR
jgi:hypothetical protein